MAMEHRLGTRHIVSIPVLIVYPPLGLVHGRLENISASGALVATEWRPEIHAHLRLYIRYRDHGRTRVMQSSAVVVRLAPGAVGMAFDVHGLELPSLPRAILAGRDGRADASRRAS
jgi:hypothetical protein